MIRALSASLLLLATAGQAQPAAPALPAKGAGPAAFVPAGWVLEQQQTADLNRDGAADALVLLKSSGLAHSSRILAVLLRQPGTATTDGYVLAASNARLIPRVESAEQADPLEEGELIVRPGGFDVKLALASTAGSYGMAVVTYRFRFERNCFRLIGYDRMETNRATMATLDLSVNYLTGVAISRRSAGEGARVRETRQKLKSRARACLPDLGSAAEFKPL